MIKVDYKIDEEKGLIMFAFEGSKDSDYEALDMLCQVLTVQPESKVGFLRSNRLVGHFKGMISPNSDGPTILE